MTIIFTSFCFSNFSTLGLYKFFVCLNEIRFKVRVNSKKNQILAPSYHYLFTIRHINKDNNAFRLHNKIRDIYDSSIIDL